MVQYLTNWEGASLIEVVYFAETPEDFSDTWRPVRRLTAFLNFSTNNDNSGWVHGIYRHYPKIQALGRALLAAAATRIF
jgi:hypothetical protein